MRVTTTPEQKVVVDKFIEPIAVTPEQKLVLDKFVAGLSDDYFDELKRESSQHPPARAEIAEFFCKNLDSALRVASIPLQLCYARVAQRRIDAIYAGERIRALKKVKPGGQLTNALEVKALAIANARFIKERGTQKGRKEVTDGTIANLGHYLTLKNGAVAAPELLSQAIVMIWGALEVLVSDTIRHEMNSDPSLAIKVATTDPSRKHFNNRISLDQLASRKFNLEHSMGDALFADRSLDSLPVMRDVLSAIAADDAPVHKAFASDGLWKLWQTRHLIVHRRGLVDQAYIDRTRDGRWSVGSRIQFDAAFVEAATDLIHNTALVFLRCWRNPRPSGRL